MNIKFIQDSEITNFIKNCLKYRWLLIYIYKIGLPHAEKIIFLYTEKKNKFKYIQIGLLNKCFKIV